MKKFRNFAYTLGWYMEGFSILGALLNWYYEERFRALFLIVMALYIRVMRKEVDRG